jgi:enoyl-CoA hydratase
MKDTMKNFTIEIDGEGIALVTFDVVGRSVNLINASVQQDLGTLVATIRNDETIRGVILRSGKKSGFCVGADLTEMPASIARWRAAATPEQLAEGVRDAGSYSAHIRELETCGKPVAVLIEGMAVGGGLELVLGCHYRIAVDDPDLHLALPEVSLGLMPGGGGTQRLLRLLGLNETMPYVLDGTRMLLTDAVATGVVHATAAAGALEETAREWIRNGGTAIAPWDVKGFQIPGGGAHGPAGYVVFGPAIAARRAGADGQKPATANILKALYEGAQVPIEAGLRIESRYFFNTGRSDQAREQVRAFLGRKK